jgi:hypothetical protein
MCASGDFAAFCDGTALARGPAMSSDHHAGVIAASVGNRASKSTKSTDEAPATTRLNAFELAFAIAAMELATDEYERPASDDEPTIEVPAPGIPPGVPSPLGDDAPPSFIADLASTTPFETLAMCELDLELDLDEEFPSRGQGDDFHRASAQRLGG